MNQKIIAAATAIVKQLVTNGHVALFTGGYVRDMVGGYEQNRETDIDIATDATPEKVATLFRKVIGIGEQFGVMLVMEQNIAFEVATFRTDHGYIDGRHPEKITFSTPQSDARRRDFTINGLFYNPLTCQIIDFVNGKKDLKNGIIRTIGNPHNRFMEDYLRMLRAIRFSAQFMFFIETSTWEALRKNANHIRFISVERIFQELQKMLTGPHPDKALELLDTSGLLPVILPEVYALKGVKQPPEYHPEGDVFQHTIKVLSTLKNASPILAWSALLHDIGKPSTQTFADRIRFNNHHHVGAIKAKNLLLRLKAPRRFMEDVCQCIENHMNFMNVTRMRLSTLKKLLSRSTFDEELALHRSDCLASHGDIENYHFLCKKKKDIVILNLRPKPLIGGRDLIKLGFKPGPIFSIILREVYDLQLNEQVNTAQDACLWVEKHYTCK